VPRTVINASTGWIVEQMGWLDFYLLCALLALPGMALLLRVAPWNGDRITSLAENRDRTGAPESRIRLDFAQRTEDKPGVVTQTRA
jgi:hypothetical protein